MKHEVEIYDGEPLNFETVYNRYIKFVNQNSSIQSVQKPVIMKAFEHIKVRNPYLKLFFSIKYLKKNWINMHIYFLEFRNFSTSWKHEYKI